MDELADALAARPVDAGEDRGHVLGVDAVEVQVHTCQGGSARGWLCSSRRTTAAPPAARATTTAAMMTTTRSSSPTGAATGPARTAAPMASQRPGRRTARDQLEGHR